MKPSAHTKEVFATRAVPAEEEQIGSVLGMLRIAKISYDHYPIRASANEKGTIGDMVDQHIAETVHKGGMVSEVILTFETIEQQHQIADIYRLHRPFNPKC